MSRLTIFCLLLLACATRCAVAADGAAVTLAELEQTLRGSELFGAGYSLPDNAAASEAVHWQGLRVYGSTSVASVDEVIDIGRSRSYNQATASAGVLLPLLGSRLQVGEAQRERALASLSLQLDTETRQRRALSELRRAYIELWVARQRAVLARDFLAEQATADNTLQQRTHAALLLESDRLEFMNAFLRAQLELTGADAAQQNARDRIAALLRAPFAATSLERPRLQSACRVAADGLDTHPELQWLRAVADGAMASPRASTLYPWRSDLRVSYVRSQETSSGQNGGAGAVSWSFDYPIGERDQWRAERARVRLQAQRASDDYRQRLADLQNELRRLTAQESLAHDGLRYAQASLAAADAKVQERQLRAGRLAGDVMEQLLQARYAQYRAAVSQLEAEANLLLVQNQWTVLAAASCRTPSELRGRSLYLWSSARFLQALQRGAAEALLQRLARAGIDRVFLSLDAAQIAASAQQSGSLRAALDEAGRQGIAVELLLGEPSWIMPAQRAELLETLQRLRDLPFSGVQLDLEPNQLDGGAGEGLAHLPDLLATLRAVRAQSALPLGLSLHPRYLNVEVEGLPLAEQLEALHIEPTLMIYVANPQRAVAIATPLFERWPQLRMRVALSLEQELDATESLAQLPAVERERRIAQLETALAAKNFAGVALQTSKPWLYEPE